MKLDEGEKTPVKVKVSREFTILQRIIAQKYVEHIKKKIDDLTKDKPDRKDNAMLIFTKLVEKVEETFEFREVGYQDVYRIISKIKPGAP